MTSTYSNPALDAELAYRREQLEAAGRRVRISRGRRFPSLRRTSL